MIRPAFWVEGVTLHVGATLHEYLLTRNLGFSLTPESCRVLVCLLVRGTWVPKNVRGWSECGSKFRSELELALEGGPADFSMMVVDSEAEILSSESKIISFSSEVKRTLAGDLSIEGGLF